MANIQQTANFQRYSEQARQSAIANLNRQLAGRGNIPGRTREELKAFDVLLSENPQLQKELSNVQQVRQKAIEGGFSNIKEFSQASAQASRAKPISNQQVTKRVEPTTTQISNKQLFTPKNLIPTGGRSIEGQTSIFGSGRADIINDGRISRLPPAQRLAQTDTPQDLSLRSEVTGPRTNNIIELQERTSPSTLITGSTVLTPSQRRLTTQAEKTRKSNENIFKDKPLVNIPFSEFTTQDVRYSVPTQRGTKIIENRLKNEFELAGLDPNSDNAKEYIDKLNTIKNQVDNNIISLDKASKEYESALTKFQNIETLKDIPKNIAIGAGLGALSLVAPQVAIPLGYALTASSIPSFVQESIKISKGDKSAALSLATTLLTAQLGGRAGVRLAGKKYNASDISASALKGKFRDSLINDARKNPLVENQLQKVKSNKDTSITTYKIKTPDGRTFEVLQYDKGRALKTSDLEIPRVGDQVILIREVGGTTSILGRGKLQDVGDETRALSKFIRIDAKANTLKAKLNKLGLGKLANYLVSGEKTTILSRSRGTSESISPGSKLVRVETKTAISNIEKVRGKLIDKLTDIIKRNKDNKFIKSSDIKEVIKIRKDLGKLFYDKEFNSLPNNVKNTFRNAIRQDILQSRAIIQKGGTGTISIKGNIPKKSFQFTIQKGSSFGKDRLQVKTESKGKFKSIPEVTMLGKPKIKSVKVGQDKIKADLAKKVNKETFAFTPTGKAVQLFKKTSKAIGTNLKSSPDILKKVATGVSSAKTAVAQLVKPKTQSTKGRVVTQKDKLSNGVIPSVKLKSEITTGQDVSNKLSQSSRLKFSSDFIEKQKKDSGVKQEQSIAQEQKMGSKQILRQRQGFRFKQESKQKNISRFRFTPRIMIKPKAPFVPTKLKKVIEKSKVKERIKFNRPKKFDVFLKSGKRLNIKPLSEKSAFGLGAKVTDVNIKASFFIKPSLRPGFRKDRGLERLAEKLAPKFRPSKRTKGLIVEKERFRLESKGRTLETKQIKSAKSSFFRRRK